MRMRMMRRRKFASRPRLIPYEVHASLLCAPLWNSVAGKRRRKVRLAS